MTITESTIQFQQAQIQTVAKVGQALMMISTGLVCRDRQIHLAILSELTGTTTPAELRKQPIELLETVAETITALGRQLSEGISFETLFELRVEAR